MGSARLGSARYWVLLLSGMGCMGLALAAWDSFEAACYVWGWYCTARWLIVAVKNMAMLWSSCSPCFVSDAHDQGRTTNVKRCSSSRAAGLVWLQMNFTAVVGLLRGT